jgi:hypothetical protein
MALANALRRTACGAVLGCGLLLPVQLVAQVGLASLSGTVTDASGALVPRAKVSLSNTDRHYIRQTITDERGTYIITAIDPGEYELTVTAPAFQEAKRTKVPLTAGQSSSLNVQLTVAAQQPK